MGEILGIGNINRPSGLKRKGKRLGRGIGSGRGKTSGRGHKGAKSRSGGGIYNPGYEGGQMPLVRRIPKRGFTNKFKKKWNIVNIGTIENFENIKNGEIIDKNFLIQNKIIRKKTLPIKILAKGSISKSLEIKADAFSKEAKTAIEKSGGKAIIQKS